MCLSAYFPFLVLEQKRSVATAYGSPGEDEVPRGRCVSRSQKGISLARRILQRLPKVVHLGDGSLKIATKIKYYDGRPPIPFLRCAQR